MNRIKIEFDAISENEAFARVCIAAFVTRLDPTLEEINDVKTAVSEAVTNAIIHGYGEKGGIVIMEAGLEENELEIIITDFGKGIENVSQAMMPMFTGDSVTWHLTLQHLLNTRLFQNPRVLMFIAGLLWNFLIARTMIKMATTYAITAKNIFLQTLQ